MPRTKDVTVYVCTDGFSPAVLPGQAPVAYRPGTQVLSSDPILRTHGHFFTLAADRIEQATAAPGERRNVPIPEPEVPETTESEEITDGEDA